VSGRDPARAQPGTIPGRGRLVSAGVLLLVVSCSTPRACVDRECPEGWEEGDEETTPCIPPLDHIVDVRRRIETGAFGYASLHCFFGDPEESGFAAEACGLARGRTFYVGAVDGFDSASLDPRLVRVDDRGLWEVELEPGLNRVEPCPTYVPGDPCALFNLHFGDRQRRTQVFELEEGELLLVGLTEPTEKP
jgi:hypothetical protein